jgi:hypothetical protein
MKKQFLIKVRLYCLSFLFAINIQAQVTFPNNFNPGNLPTRFVGWDNTVGVPLRVEHQGNLPILFSTNGLLRTTITTNNGLVNTNLANFNFNVAPQTGDGIRIAPAVGSNATASIDLFTSIQNQTFLRLDGTTLFQTTNNRFETISNLNGFWYNATGNGANGAPGPFTPQFIWNIQQNERGRLGNNGFWHFGNGNVNALNTVEIQSSALSPYGATNSSGLRFTNLTSASTPIANGVNGVNSSKLLTVDQNGDIVLTNAGAVITSNNGVFNNGGMLQLGAPCSNPTQVIFNGFTTDRAVFNGNQSFWFASGNTQTGGVGIGGQPSTTAFCGTGNTFEVSANARGKYGNTNASGIRLSKLTSASPIIPNGTNGVNSTKLLSVDQDGDIVLTNAIGLVGPVGPAGPPGPSGGAVTAQNGLSNVSSNVVELGGILLHNTNINLATYNLSYYTGATQFHQREPSGATWQKAVGPVGIGAGGISFSEEVIATNTSNWNYGRELDLSPQSAAVSPATTGLVGNKAKVTGGVAGDVYAFYGESTNIGAVAGNNYTIKAKAIGAGTGKQNVGFYTEAFNGDKNYGFYSLLAGANASTEDNGVRVHSQSNGGTLVNKAGNFKALQGQNVYGIYAEAFGGALTNYAGYFQGDVFINGPSQIAGLAMTASDQMFKINIDSISNAQNIIKQLKPKTFYYDTTNTSKINFSSKKQYGLIAQEVELILPELVGNVTKPAERDSLGNITVPAVTYKNLNYNAFISILIKGMQTQQRQIEKQDSIINLVQSQLAALTSSVSSCCSSTAVRTTKAEELNQLNINLNDNDVIVLNQNVPNPFAEQTTITYNVPEKYGYAQIIFSTIDGRILKTVDITKKGHGQLNVFANDLGNGLYTYSLVVDGKVIDTKKMVKGE